MHARGLECRLPIDTGGRIPLLHPAGCPKPPPRQTRFPHVAIQRPPLAGRSQRPRCHQALWAGHRAGRRRPRRPPRRGRGAPGRELGAGKSTISSIIAGLVQPSAGTMTWNAKPYAPASPAEALAQGIGLIHQEMKLLPDLTIAENVFVGRLPAKFGRCRPGDDGQARRRTGLHRLGLDVSPTKLVRELRSCRPAAGRDRQGAHTGCKAPHPRRAHGRARRGRDRPHLFEQVERLKKEGMCFIYISHRLDEIARIADRIMVLRDGRLVGSYDTAQVPVKVLVEAMVGRSVEAHVSFNHPAGGQRSAAGRRPDRRLIIPSTILSFAVEGAGEVFGIAGIVGAGRTELSTRHRRRRSDRLRYDHRQSCRLLAPKSPAGQSGRRHRTGARGSQGARARARTHTIGDNIALGNYPPPSTPPAAL